MATARVIPFEDNPPVQLIAIDATYTPSSEGCFIQAGQSVTFTNNSGVTIDIKFTPNPITPTVFNDILGLAKGNSSNPQTPLVAAGTANYGVYVGGVHRSGPYAIQVGAGPMKVQIQDSSSGPVCTPNPVAIPHDASAGGGTLEMVSADYVYAVGPAPFSDMFNPPLTSADSKPHTNMSGAGDFDYTVTQKSPKLGGGGGGTVKIKNT